MTSRSIESNVQGLIIEPMINDDDDQGSLGDAFYDNDLLPDDFAMSKDFTVVDTNLGEDEFGAFEYEPPGSISGSIDNQASFACNSTPVSPERVIPRKTINMFETIDVSSISQEELCTDVGAPMSEVFLDLKDIALNPIEVSPLHLREENNAHFRSETITTNMELPNFNRVSESLSNARSSSISSIDNYTSMQNNGSHQTSPNSSYHNPHESSAGAVDTMFQQFTLEQLEPEPIIHHQQNHVQQNMHQNQAQQSQLNQLQYNQHMPMQSMQQQYQPSQSYAHQQSFHQPNHQATAMIEPSQHVSYNNNMQQMQKSSHHRNNNYQSTNHMMSHSTHGVPFSGSSPRNHSLSLSNNSYHGVPFRNGDVLASSSYHGEFPRRSSNSIRDETIVGNPSMHGRQTNVAIPPEHHSPQKFFNRGYEVSQQSNPASLPPSNMTDVMEKLSVSMRRSAMSRSMVKHISNRTIGSQNSARGIASNQGSSRGFGQNSSMMMSHHSNKNLMKQGSEHGNRTLPIRRMSNTAKHPLPGRSIHHHDSHRSLSQSNHGQITLQIDDRNVGTF